MNHFLCAAVVTATVGLLGASSWAAGENVANADTEAKQVNARMARRAELMLTVHKLDAEIRRSWLDEANTSPEIAKLRARYAELQRELEDTRRAIQAKVKELPAVAAKIRDRDNADAQVQELSKLVGDKSGK